VTARRIAILAGELRNAEGGVRIVDGRHLVYAQRATK
jgi:hypothetical protein